MISILSDINKLFEKLIYSRVYHFMIKNYILSQHQFGYQSNKSTSDALIDQLQYLYDSIDGNNTVFSTFLNFQTFF